MDEKRAGRLYPMSSNPRISIIIINWNGKDKLGTLFDECLESVMHTKYTNFEVVFVDNASNDGSYEYAKERFKNFKFIRNKENLGFVGGNNVGAKLCNGNIIVFLNTDTIVDPCWLDEPADLFKNQKIGIVQANLRMLSNPSIPDSIGHSISTLCFPIENSFFMAEPQEAVPIFAGKGAALFVRREVFERLNGFDEDYFFYFEETDLCWRAHLLGYEVYFAPCSLVLHKGGATFKNEKILYGALLYHRQKNTISSMIKCYEVKNLLKYLPLRLLVEMAGIVFLLFKKPSLALGNVKALVWVARNRRKLFRSRHEIQGSRIVKDDELFQRGFIKRSLILTIRYLRSRFKIFEGAT